MLGICLSVYLSVTSRCSINTASLNGSTCFWQTDLSCPSLIIHRVVSEFAYFQKKYVGPCYCPAEMYTGRVAWCPLESHGEYADGTDRLIDGRTPDSYIMLLGCVLSTLSILYKSVS